MALSQWKEAILEGIFTEIKQGLVEEKNLERLENLVEILHKEGSKVPESVKNSYCRVAVECTVRHLGDEREAYNEAIRSIWLARVMPLCDKVSCLVTRELLDNCKRLWTAYGDDEACEALRDECTRERAIASLRNVVSELHPDIHCDYGERDDWGMDDSEETGDSEEMEEEEGMLSSDAEEEITSGVSEVESPPTPPRRMKTIPSPLFDKALQKLRGSKIDLMNALAEGGGGGPSNFNATSIIQQENYVVDGPAATDKLTLMERRATAQTYEWKDSIDDSDGETGDDAEVRGERIVVSPWKRNQGGGNRTKIPWSTAETLAVMKGYEKYGADWKRIKDECPILVRRTNGDIKDKFRVEMRRQEHHP